MSALLGHTESKRNTNESGFATPYETAGKRKSALWNFLTALRYGGINQN